MPTIDIELYDALTAANVPDDKARAAAAALMRNLAETRQDLVTSIDLGNAVDRLEAQFKSVEQRLDHKIDSTRQGLSAEIRAIDAKIDAVDAKIDAVDKRWDAKFSMLQWMVGLNFLISLGILWRLLR